MDLLIFLEWTGADPEGVQCSMLKPPFWAAVFNLLGALAIKLEIIM
jgi:hypothetical protein